METCSHYDRDLHRLFLSFLDVRMVAVALTTITNEFSEFGQSSWIFTAHTITYMAFGVVLPQLSDSFGVKTMALLSIVSFLVSRQYARRVGT